jgi:hypothetical protein
MKWVHLGVAQGILFVAAAAAWDKAHRTAILAGGGAAAVLLYAQYAHAKTAGLAAGGPPTEKY